MGDEPGCDAGRRHGADSDPFDTRASRGGALLAHHALAPVDAGEQRRGLGIGLITTVDEILTIVQDEQPPVTAAGSEGSVTIIFTDLEGSTAPMESSARREMARLDRMARRCGETADDALRRERCKGPGRLVPGGIPRNGFRRGVRGDDTARPQ